jgi:hypothetical protein
MRFLLPLILLLSCSFSANAAEWKSLRCQNESEGGFLLLTKDANGTFHVETAQTRRYLLGLDCKVPAGAEPLFYCGGGGGDGLEFFSGLIHERGFTKESYGSYVDQERLEIVLRYSYKDAQGKDQRLERTWKYAQADCVGSEQ